LFNAIREETFVLIAVIERSPFWHPLTAPNGRRAG
jgi:hypothetical protein